MKTEVVAARVVYCLKVCGLLFINDIVSSSLSVTGWSFMTEAFPGHNQLLLLFF